MLWYALRVKQRYENLANGVLRNRGFETFLPLYHARRQWSDRIKVVDLPLFPGYVFCSFDLESRLPVLTAPGVYAIVGFGNRPTPVDSNELAAVRAAVDCRMPAEPYVYLNSGTRVVIHNGPLQGIEGIVIRDKDQDRLVISISLLRRSVAVTIDRAWILPVESPAGVQTTARPATRAGMN